MTEEQLTEQEKELVREIAGYGGSAPEGKHNVHTFLFNVATAEDTTKLGNLTEQELGNLDSPVRAYKHLASFAKDIMDKPELSSYFGSQGEIATATSLSKHGFLVSKATESVRKVADITKKPRKENSGWFGKKKEKEEDGGQE